jgi:DNA-binding response OmpR family regulator
MQFQVLLALEEPHTLEFYRANLEYAGFEVVVTDPAGALAAARTLRPAIIVIDGSRTSGAHTCREFKSDARLRRVPIIAMAPPDASATLDGACDAVLPVQCLPDVLVATIDRLLVAHLKNS